MRDRRRLFIIGASHFGREMESWLSLVPEEQRDWTLAGFLHTPPSPSPLAGFPSALDVVGDWQTFAFSGEDYVVCAVADPGWKERVWGHLQGRVRFFTYIAPSAVVGRFNEFGEGVIVCPNCVLTTNIRLGTCVTLNVACGLGHDVRVGDFCSLMGRVSLTGGVNVERKVLLGSGATVLPHKSVGEGSTVGAGSVVIRNVRAGTTVFGNPARVLQSDAAV